MLTQTTALFLDAYRELNSKKLFWIFLIISGFVVLALAGLGIDAEGITFFTWQLKSPFNTTLISKAQWYKYLFSNLGIGFWLTWCGMVLAILSTSAIFPEMVAGGSVDLYLSRPISRIRLFVTKYLCGLLFVAIQVAVFALACFLVIGIRGSLWEPKIFLCIPLVVLVFSFLYCVCVFVAIFTKSVIASVLLTILFWFLVFGIDAGEKWTLLGNIKSTIETQAYANQFSYKEKDLTLQRERLARVGLSTEDKTAVEKQIQAIEQSQKALEEKKRKSDPARHNWATAERILYAAKSVLPKTSETNSLLDRWINVTDEITEEKRELHDKRRASGGWLSRFEDRTEVNFDDSELLREQASAIRERPVTWVLGTSLAFEFVVISLAAWKFCRQDF